MFAIIEILIERLNHKDGLRINENENILPEFFNFHKKI